MSNSAKNSYASGWLKLSRKLRLIYPCAVCGKTEFTELECHHIDFDKKNNKISNLIVLCKEHHLQAHKNVISLPEVNYKISGQSVTVARIASSDKDWFDSKSPLKIISNLDSKIAMEFRKSHVKGFIKAQGCNLYIGLYHNSLLVGVLGFSNPDYGTYDVLMKADTTPSEYENSTDLLLYVLRTKEVQISLENKFNRKINTAYSMCFSQHKVINRYRKHAEKIQEKEVKGGFNLGYLFQLGTIPTLKAAKAEFMQKHKIL